LSDPGTGIGADPPTTIQERWTSRGGASDSIELHYIVSGSASDAVIRAYVALQAPSTYAGLFRQAISINPLSADAVLNEAWWEVTVPYRPRQPGQDDPPQTGDSRFEFDTTGGTQHITQSLETITSVGGNPGIIPTPDFGGAIGVSADSVDGTDIIIADPKFNETHYLAVAGMTQSYRNLLIAMTGTVNNAPFRGYEAGEVLFLGARGGPRGDDDWEVGFAFAVSLNRQDIEIPNIELFDAEGWDYVWVYYLALDDVGAIVKRPAAAYVERVYERSDFTLLGIG